MVKGKRFTTVNCDAGHKDGVYAYAYWIRSNEVRFNHSGKFEKPKEDMNDAELACILKALLIVSRDAYLRNADIIVVNCDNKSALYTLKNRLINSKSVYYKVWKEIQSNINSPIFYKWVKSHSKGRTPREWINNYIDKEIRKHYPKINKSGK